MSELNPQCATMIQNDSGEEIPPHAVVVISFTEITEATDENESTTIHHVTKYVGQDGNILVTGPIRIPAGLAATGGWSPEKSFGQAFADNRIYVQIDPYVSPPLPGEIWGPTEGEWYITRGGNGFKADGYPDTGTSSGFPSLLRAVFMRTSERTWYWGKIVDGAVIGSFESPAVCYVDAWVEDRDSMLDPRPLIRSDNPDLQRIKVVSYLQCLGDPSSSSSSSSSRFGPSDLNSGPLQCRIEQHNGRWELLQAWRCREVVTAVTCGSSGLTVTYGKVGS